MKQTYKKYYSWDIINLWDKTFQLDWRLNWILIDDKIKYFPMIPEKREKETQEKIHQQNIDKWKSVSFEKTIEDIQDFIKHSKQLINWDWKSNIVGKELRKEQARLATSHLDIKAEQPKKNKIELLEMLDIFPMSSWWVQHKYNQANIAENITRISTFINNQQKDEETETH